MIDSILIIIEHILLHLPLMVGAYISISLLKVPDLSIESAYVTGAFCGAKMVPLVQTFPFPVQLVLILGASLCGGGIVGTVSSLCTKKLGFSHLLSTIITFGIFYGLNQFFAGTYFSLSGYTNVLMVPLLPRHPEFVILACIGIFILTGAYLLFKTQLGYTFAIYGLNNLFFQHYGISSTYVFISGIVISNMCAGLSGYLFAQTSGFVELNMAFGKALLCITALILGKSLVRSKHAITITVPSVGLFCYFTLQQLLLKSGFNLKYFTIVQAVLVLIILSLLRRSDDHVGVNELGV